MAIQKWVEKKLADLERERDTAIKALNEMTDTQTKSGIYVQRLDCIGEKAGPTYRKAYVQSQSVNVEHAGVKLYILLRENKIDISFDNSEIGEVVSIYPNAANSISFAASKGI